jgi:hypothetical protein
MVARPDSATSLAFIAAARVVAGNLGWRHEAEAESR